MKQLYIRMKTEEQLRCVLAWGKADVIVPDFSLFDLLVSEDGKWRKTLPEKISACFCLPDIAREKRMGSMKKRLAKIPEDAAIMVKNPDELGLVQELTRENPKSRLSERLIGDSFLYAYNSEALEFYLENFPAMKFLLSDELTGREMNELVRTGRAEFICKIYGYQPLMISSQCTARNYTDCREKTVRFRDEKGMSFLAAGSCEQCCSIVYNGQHTWLLDKTEELPCDQLLIDLTIEDQEETKAVLKAYEAIISDPDPSAAADRKSGFTRGHFYKGID